ncbi:unnamed protein product [Cylicocyclus nassatus]|uniref:Uncharacterized protein n=1 Tax=Cylicocyclus nassatus TaxID=53992 RepID=A0AA36HE43_CYLNA|nr:unnamed protein product [Cylicocyclus nassatus]
MMSSIDSFITAFENPGGSTTSDDMPLASGDAQSEPRRLRSPYTRPYPEFKKNGTSGTKVQLKANFARITQMPDVFCTQYHVEFEPTVASRSYRHQILKGEEMQSYIGSAFIFDGMIMYTVTSANFEGDYVSTHPHTGEKIVVRLHRSVRFTQEDAQTINCYNIVIRNCLDMVGMKRLGRNHFDEMEKRRLDHYGMEVWPGFETAVRHYEDQLMLCIENRFKMIRTESVWEIMCRERSRPNQDLNSYEVTLQNLLYGETVFARYNNRMYRINHIDYEMTPYSEFTLADGNVTSLKAYFEKQYNLVIREGNQPILVSEVKAKLPGEAPMEVYLLPELVYPTGLTTEMRHDFRCMKELSAYTRLDPERRSETTKRLLDKITGNERCVALMRTWGIVLNNDLVSFHSRELSPERLYGAADQGYAGVRAEWARHVRSHGTYRGMFLQNWVLIAPGTDDGRRLSVEFINEVENIYTTMQIRFCHPMVEYCSDASPKAYRNAVENAMARAAGQSIHMMVVILADSGKIRYDSLKKWLCTETNIPSQCVQLSTLRGPPRDNGRSRNFASIVLKIALQMNCKMGGALWKVIIPMKKAMIVGYDLYHDSSLEGKTFGACVSTMDENYTEFFSQTRAHVNPTELGTNLRSFVKEALKKYFQRNHKTLPEKIFLYRDGVGDGQIPYVVDQEVSLVQQACAEAVQKAGYPAGTKIKLAFIIVTKKVNLRVFKWSPNGRLSNPDPGTVVDSVITRPERYDFYLVPQYVNQGTVTPVCYNVIYDDTGLEPDKHHKLAYKLCHLYYNWQGTVRVPAPCQYAHKLAFLAAQTLHQEATEDLRHKLFFL